jgi:hypothetical protein
MEKKRSHFSDPAPMAREPQARSADFRIMIGKNYFVGFLTALPACSTGAGR